MTDNDFPLVVGIGASAGGLQAFRELLGVLPTDSGAVYLLVQHLDPNHESLLSELLAPHTTMPVHDAEQGERLCADTVHVIGPGDALAVRDGRIELTEPTLHRGIRLPVDHLFRSLAREYGSRSVGIVLSGAGSDGSSGLRDIKGAGGLTIAQEPDSSGQRGMPSAAIDTGLIDFVLEIDQMPKALQRFANLPEDARMDPPAEERDAASNAEDDARRSEDIERGDDAMASGTEDDTWPATSRIADNDLNNLKALLAAQIDFDLGVYKGGTVERRVLRRTLLSGFERVADYIDFLRERTDEQQTLVRDLLISVTSFFRDTRAHKALRDEVIDPLIRDISDGGKVRAWVAGCATGEEAYSLGMTLLDAAVEHGKSIELHIFATDVDQEALSFARQGCYPPSIVEQVPERKLERYFHPFDGQGYRVRAALRDSISFAAHDLTRDPPFSRMDIVSCRNVLIYLTPDAQRHVLGILHFALRENAYLALSTSESPGAQPDLFRTVSKSARLYRKNGMSRALSIPRESRERKSDNTRLERAEGQSSEASSSSSPRASDPARRAVLDAWVPPTLVVSSDGAVLFMHGELGPYLRFPQGDDPRFSLDAMLRKELATRTRGALYRCRDNARTHSVLSSPDDGLEQRVRITATPATSLGDGAVMLSFEDLSVATATGDDRPATRRLAQRQAVTLDHETSQYNDSSDEVMLEQLENELRATREDLRNTVEELESSNEKLRSSNEESMSMNEELQSANEELEATTEELRSLNEELTTVNSQLREKVEQLEQVYDDLGNFFASSRVAMVFLDDRLRNKRFPPAAGELLGIDRGDVGRYTGDMARELLHRDLEQEARAVLEQLETRSRDLQTHDGRWFARRVLPYYTESRRIEGVVVTLLDVSDMRRATEKLAERERQQSVIARLGLDALGEVDLQEFMNRTVEQVAKTLALDYCKILELQPGGELLLLRAGTGWHEGLVGSGHVDGGADSQAGYTLEANGPVLVADLATETRFSGPDLLIEHNVTSGLSCTIRGAGEVYGVIGGHTTNRRIFDQEDADFLQAVANVVGSTIDHFQARLRTRLENAVARTLIANGDTEDTFVEVQHCLCAALGTVAGEVWEPADDNAGPFTRRLLYTVPGERRQEFDERLTARDIGRADDIVARVIAGGRAIGVSDIGQPALFAGDEPLLSLGLSTALGFPLYSGGRLLGVMTLFARKRLFIDETFLRSLDRIGQVIADSLLRSRHERRAARLAAITESSHDALFSYDARGRVTEWLPGAERLFGYDAPEMIGTPVSRLVPEELRSEMRSIGDRILAGERLEPFESVRLAHDGRRIEVSVRSSPILDAQGNIIGVSSTDRDIARQKDAERRLLAADLQKDEFLAMLGHELRNPLASIRTAAELLGMNAREDDEARHARTIIQRQSTHMANLLDGLLDVSRIVNGKVTLDRRTIDFVEVCRTVVEDSSERAAANGLLLHVELPTSALQVEADRTRLVQIVDNLVSNSIRYTPPGGTISLVLSREHESIALHVRDDGIGIEEELLPHVFDVFRQSSRNLDRAEGGLGLGLALVRSLVAMHDGTVDAYSDGENCGAEFVVRLPASESMPPQAFRPALDVDAGLSILIVEDNPDTADVLCRVLRRLGHRVETTTHGRTGVELAVERAPDVVLCDIGLPDGYDGYDVVRELRRRPETRTLPMAAVSGYGRPEDKTRSLQAGFDLHLTKPVSLAMLRDALGELVSGNPLRREVIEHRKAGETTGST